MKVLKGHLNTPKPNPEYKPGIDVICHIFRAKSTNAAIKKWIFGSPLGFCVGDEKADFMDFDGALREVQTKTIGLSTSAIDMNDEKVFEGDVLATDDGEIIVPRWNKDVCGFVLDVKYPCQDGYSWEYDTEFDADLIYRSMIIGDVFSYDLNK